MKNYIQEEDLRSFFSNDEIDILMKEGVIKYNGRKFYYENLRTLTAFVKYLLSAEVRNISFADKILDFSFYLFPNYSLTTNLAFYRSIQEKDYTDSFKYLKILLNCTNPFYQKFFRVVLFLMDYVTVVPDELKEKINSFKKNDYLLTEKELKSVKNGQKFQELYYAVIYNRFGRANNLLSSIRFEGEEANINTVLLKELITKAMNKRSDFNNFLVKLIKENNIIGAILFLEREKSERRICLRDKFVLKSLYDLASLDYRNAFCVKDCSEDANVYDAINAKNYEVAKKRLEVYETEEYSVLLKVINTILLRLEESKNNPNKVSLTDDEAMILFSKLLDSGVTVAGAAHILRLPIEKSLVFAMNIVDNLKMSGQMEKSDKLLTEIESIHLKSEDLVTLREQLKNEIISKSKHTI